MKKAVVLLVALIAIAQPIRIGLEEKQPPRADANKLGLGPLLGGVMTGAFRPMLMNYLYLRADILAGQGRFDEQVTLFRSMVQLYPNNHEARGFLGWWLAFNAKREAPRPDLGWRWAEEGLDILRHTPGEERTVAIWFMGQCGQNAFSFYRYAGREWSAELPFRGAIVGWTKRVYGEPLHRFDAALRALGEPEDEFARVLELRIQHAGLIDDWMRTGKSDKLDAVRAGLNWTAELFQGLPPQRDAALRRAAILEAVAAGSLDPAAYPLADEFDAYGAWALGMHRGDVGLLRAARALLDRLARHPFTEEKASIDSWIAWLESDRSTPRPPTPFEG